MLNAFGLHHDRLVPVVLRDGSDTVPLWVDLLDPTPDEIALVANRFGIAVPSRAAMDAIEPSARLFVAGDIEVLTLTVARLDDATEGTTPLTFAVGDGPLVTVRHVDPTPFGNFVHRPLSEGTSTGALLIGLIESIIDRIADALEGVGKHVDGVSREVFEDSSRNPTVKTRNLEAILERIGREGEILTRLRESLVSLSRATGFHAARLSTAKGARDHRNRLRTVQRDVASLTDHAGFLSSKINFLLDATLGLINLEQNTIIKVFTVAAVAFLPPTLIASIYGMNFDVMPELRWHYGYPFGIALMIASMIIPFAYFRRRGWL